MVTGKQASGPGCRRMDGETRNTEMAWGRSGDKRTEAPGNSTVLWTVPSQPLFKDGCAERDRGLDDCGQSVSSADPGFQR